MKTEILLEGKWDEKCRKHLGGGRKKKIGVSNHELGNKCELLSSHSSTH